MKRPRNDQGFVFPERKCRRLGEREREGEGFERSEPNDGKIMNRTS